MGPGGRAGASRRFGMSPSHRKRRSRRRPVTGRQRTRGRENEMAKGTIAWAVAGLATRPPPGRLSPAIAPRRRARRGRRPARATPSWRAKRFRLPKGRRRLVTLAPAAQYCTATRATADTNFIVHDVRTRPARTRRSPDGCRRRGGPTSADLPDWKPAEAQPGGGQEFPFSVEDGANARRIPRHP